MKPSGNRDMGRKLSMLRKRCPWMASVILHCLESQNPKLCEAMRVMLARLRTSTN